MAKPKTTAAKPKMAAKPKPKTAAKTKRPAPRIERTAAAPEPKKAARSAPMPTALERLWTAMEEVRAGRRDSPRTARLLAAGAPKMAQKVVEEAAEVAIEAVLGRRDTLINESVDLLYNLAALLSGSGVALQDLWTEMDRREAALGMAEKLPKADEV